MRSDSRFFLSVLAFRAQVGSHLATTPPQKPHKNDSRSERLLVRGVPLLCDERCALPLGYSFHHTLKSSISSTNINPRQCSISLPYYRYKNFNPFLKTPLCRAQLLPLRGPRERARQRCGDRSGGAILVAHQGHVKTHTFLRGARQRRPGREDGRSATEMRSDSIERSVAAEGEPR